MPSLRGSLKESGKLYGAWKTFELLMRAVPFSPKVLLAMVGAALMEEDWCQAAAYLLGFMCMLHTGELVGLRWGGVSFHKTPHRMVVKRGLTKGGYDEASPTRPLSGEDKPSHCVTLRSSPGHLDFLMGDARVAVSKHRA